MPRIDSTTSPRGPVECIRQPHLLGLFLLNGLLMSSWLARIPAVRDDLGLTPGQLGTLLPLGAVGTIALASLASAVLGRLGGGSTLLVATVGHASAFALLGAACAAGSTALLVAGLVINGGAFSLGNLPINVESAGLERRAGRPILPRFHAAYSLGTVAGSLIGVVCAAAGVAVLAQFLATAAVAAIWRLTSLPHVIHDTRRPARSRPAARPARSKPRTAGARPETPAAWREGRILLIGLVVLSATICEGAAGDWLSLAVVDGFGHSDAAGAAVFAVFVSSMTAVRIAGTWITGRLGRATTLRVSAVVAAAGILLFATAPVFPAAVLGVVAWGCGTGLVVPLAVSAASEDPTRTAGRVALVTGLASFASLAAPPILGAAATAVGPRSALVLVLVVVAVVLGLSRSVRPSAAVAPARDVVRPDAATTHPSAVPEAATARPGPASPDPAAPEAPRPEQAAHRAGDIDPARPRRARLIRHRGLLDHARTRRLRWRSVGRPKPHNSRESIS